MAGLDKTSSFHVGSATLTDFRPSPENLDQYLPWACDQLQCEYAVRVHKIAQVEYVGANPKKSAKMKPKKSASEVLMSETKLTQSPMVEEHTIKIYAIYDSSDNLVQLKFLKNPYIPRLIFQILGLIIQYQKSLTTIVVNKGLDSYAVHEMAKFLSVSYITDLVLDNTCPKSGNYSALLENLNCVKRISLARCKINDAVVETIAVKLVHPLPASKTLVILDLSTNKITDKGATYLALALRSNRCLSYLNLSDNSLTDAGGCCLLDSLVTFQLTTDEIISSRERLLNYYKMRNQIVAQNMVLLQVSDQSKSKRKSLRPAIPKRKSVDKMSEQREGKRGSDVDPLLYLKACAMAEDEIGTFNDPYSTENLLKKDGKVFCLGNNTLCYLNLLYNNLTYISIRKIFEVVKAQKLVNRKPLGLINIRIDGNYMPMCCMEMANIEENLNELIPDKYVPKKRRC